VYHGVDVGEARAAMLTGSPPMIAAVGRSGRFLDADRRNDVLGVRADRAQIGDVAAHVEAR
jgi:hypothetical protein